MVGADEPEWITATRAAELLGLRPHTVYALIDSGELDAEVTRPPGPKRRRRVKLQRSAVGDYLAKARVKPGELRHLYQPPT